MANRSNIMGLHGLKNKTSRNSFDLSYRNLFTAKVGELLPCFVQEVNPGDSLKLESSYFTRTAPLQSAAFTRLRENVQYFFVPYQCLWKFFESQVNNMTKNANGGDISQIALTPFSNSKVSTEMPYITYQELHDYVNALMTVSDSNATEFTMPNRFNNGTLRHCATSKLLQLLGYGNFNQQFLNLNNSNYKLVRVTHAPALSVFRLLAYQKICNDFYTYRQWQPYNASLCNIDYITPDSKNMDLGSYFGGITSSSNLNKTNFLDLRFSNLPLDYFNGVLPSPQFGSDSVVNLSSHSSSTLPDSSTWTSVDNTNVSPYVSVTSGNGGERPNNFQLKAGSVLIQHSHQIPANALSSSFSVLALRQATALQKYKEIQLANDPDFESQVEAHFGIKPQHDMHKSRFIGGSSSMIDINPVVNQTLNGTINDSGSPITKAAPTGQGSSTFKFTADTYGVVIGIYRCTPVLDYEHVGIDRTLLKTDASDFVIPELDSIGMQQSFCCEVFSPSSVVPSASTPTFDMSLSFGYAPRYSEYKTSYDRYNGAFGSSLKSWVTGMNSSALYYFPSTAPNLPYINVPRLFVCRPDIVKNIFALSSYHTSNDDNLYVGMVNMCYATRNLSRYGLPYSN